MTLRPIVVDNDEGFDSLRDQWERLVLATPSATPFHSWAWCRAYWRNLAPSGSQLRIFLVRDEDGDLRGLAPMFIQPGSALRPSLLTSLGTQVGDYGGFLMAEEESTDPFDVLWRCILQQDPLWDSIEIAKLRAEIPNRPDIRRGWRTNENEPCYCVSLPDSSNEYMQQLGRKTRENLRRRQRRLERNHKLRFWSVRTRDELEPILEQFVHLQRARFASRYYFGFFKNQDRVRFLRNVATQFLDDGWLDLHCLEIDGELAAVQFGTELHGSRLNFQIAMDMKFARHSPGMLLMLSSIKGAIARGIHEYDLLSGTAGYKKALLAQPRYTTSLTWTRRPFATNLQRNISRLRERMESVYWIRRLTFNWLKKYRVIK